MNRDSSAGVNPQQTLNKADVLLSRADLEDVQKHAHRGVWTEVAKTIIDRDMLAAGYATKLHDQSSAIDR
jgi:hypothetical protein